MSGIAGIIRFDGGPIESGKIEKITGAMSYRGPDGINHWVGNSVALGQCMLRTTPESLEETQPLSNEDDSLVLVMDGRVDNWQEMRVELLSRGARLRTRADAELVLRAYEVWGRDCPNHLLGDFAFAIWDERRKELFCARDHFGVKPFYYFKGAKFLVFASDEEAFFGLPEVPREPNEDRIACVLVPEFDGVDFDESWLKGIVKLPPAKTMTVVFAGEISLRQYWKLEPRDESTFTSDAECEEAFRVVFCDAVRRRVRTIGSPALMLSGGIDSASIAGAARHVQSMTQGQVLKTFSVVSDNPETCAETRNIRSIIQGYEQDAHLFNVSDTKGIRDADLEYVAWSKAHPVDNSILLPGLMYQAASRAGCRVMLDGVDGDLATYTPIRFYSSLIRAGKLRNAWAEIQQARVNNTYLQGRSSTGMLALGIWDVFATRQLRQVKNAVVRGMARPSLIESSLIDPGFARRISLEKRLEAYLQEGGADGQLSDQQRHIRTLTPVGLARGMEGFDRVAARYGIEPRHPWVDKKLVEFFVRLPQRYKVRNGWTKFLVRCATSHWIASEVRWHNQKDHFGSQLLTRAVVTGDDRVRTAFKGAGRVSLNKYVDTRQLESLSERYYKSTQYLDVALTHDMATLVQWIARIQKAY